jgi:hypothetical protein
MTYKLDCAPLLLASALAVAPAPALATPSVRSIHESLSVEETDNIGGVVNEEAGAAAPTGTLLHIGLGNGLNAFGEPTFAQAFAALPGGAPDYWVGLSSDSSLAPLFHGNGRAAVDVNYDLIKRTDADTIVLHVNGGVLQLTDQDFGRVPLRADVQLSAFVNSGESHTNFHADASLSGNSGPKFERTFDFTSKNLGVTQADFTLKSSGFNDTGATLLIPESFIPVDLSTVLVDSEFDLEVTLDGEVSSPGGEVVASAYFRDPAHINDADPLAGGLSIILGESSVVSAPEPSTSSLLMVALPALLVLLRRRGSRETMP